MIGRLAPEITVADDVAEAAFAAIRSGGTAAAVPPEAPEVPSQEPQPLDPRLENRKLLQQEASR